MAVDDALVLATVHHQRLYFFAGVVNSTTGPPETNPQHDLELQLLEQSFASITLR